MPQVDVGVSQKLRFGFAHYTPKIEFVRHFVTSRFENLLFPLSTWNHVGLLEPPSTPPSLRSRHHHHQVGQRQVGFTASGWQTSSGAHTESRRAFKRLPSSALPSPHLMEPDGTPT